MSARNLRVALDLRWLQQAYRNAPDGGLGGIAVFSRNLWIGLAEVDPSIELVALLDSGDIPAGLADLVRQAASRSTVVRLGGRLRFLSETRASHRLLTRFMENELTATSGIRRLDIDVLHRLDHTPPPRRATFATVVTIYDVIGLEPPRSSLPLHARILTQCEQRMFALNARADALAAISETTARELAGRYPVFKDRIHVIFAGIQCRSAEPAARFNAPSSASPYFLHVGVLTARKNPIGLLQGFAQYVARHGRNTRLICTGPYGANADVVVAVRTLARRLGIDELVEIVDRINDSALGELYRGATALVFPSFSEGFGLPLIECLGFGTPCVAADIAPCREAAGPLGIYVNPNSPESIAVGMERASQDDHRSRVAEHGAVWAERFSVATMAAKYVELYRQALESKKRRESHQ